MHYQGFSFGHLRKQVCLAYISVVTTSWVAPGVGVTGDSGVVADTEGLSLGEDGDAGEVAGGDGTSVLIGATHLVQMVLVLVTRTVETVGMISTEVLPALMWVVVWEQLVTVV